MEFSLLNVKTFNVNTAKQQITFRPPREQLREQRFGLIKPTFASAATEGDWKKFQSILISELLVMYVQHLAYPFNPRWTDSCIGRCTIALRALGHWLVVDAGCVALAGALLRCARVRDCFARRSRAAHWGAD
jgi:hypothetical protein